MPKIFNRDVRLSGGASLYVNEIQVIDGDGNIDAPVTTTDLTTSGNTTLGDASADTITLNGTTTANAPITVGVDDTGYDVKFFGATASANLLWDESADTLKLNGVASLQALGTGLIGYGTGAGGTVTQATNRTTGVTLSKTTGQITTDSTSLAAGAAATFTVTNTLVAATDVIIVNIASGETTNQTNVRVTGVAAGSFDITVENNHASTAETGAIVINFAVIKGVAA